MGYEVACLCMCVSVGRGRRGLQRQKAGWDVWERICLSNKKLLTKSQTNFICQVKFIISYFIAHLYAFVPRGCETRVCVSSSFSLRESAVAHNAANNATQHSGYGLKGVWITPIISVTISRPLFGRLLLVWSDLIECTSPSESYNALSASNA